MKEYWDACEKGKKFWVGEPPPHLLAGGTVAGREQKLLVEEVGVLQSEMEWQSLVAGSQRREAGKGRATLQTDDKRLGYSYY